MAAQSMGPATDLIVLVESAPAESFVHCSGRITASTIGTLLDHVHPLIPETRRIILDLAQVGYIDSSGIGTIVRLWSSAGKSHCSFQITNLSPRIKELLSMTSLATLFQC